MKRANYTPGPWTVESKNVVASADFRLVCSEANAQLIASAPDLVAALTMLIDATNCHGMTTEQIRFVNSVLDKATGPGGDHE